MIKIAHIVNPVKTDKTSDLFVAQPVTFASMLKAQDWAKQQADVSLFSAQYPEDRSLVPPLFQVTDDLDRSVMDVSRFRKERKLPLINDILERLYNSSDAEYLVYSNVDIALMPFFYTGIRKLIDNGHDACIINRRTISNDFSHPDQLDYMFAQLGQAHPGYDCFVFKRRLFPVFNLGNACIGANWIGKVLAANLVYHSKNFKLIENRHLTFHLGDDRAWQSDDFVDYDTHNKQELMRILAQMNLGSLADDKMLLHRFVRALKKSAIKEKQATGIADKAQALLKSLWSR